MLSLVTRIVSIFHIFSPEKLVTTAIDIYATATLARSSCANVDLIFRKTTPYFLAWPVRVCSS